MKLLSLLASTLLVCHVRANFDHGYHTQHDIIVFLPFNGSRIMGWEAIPAIEYALDIIKNDSSFHRLLHLGHHFDTRIIDVECSASEGLFQFVELHSNSTRIDAIIGPYCDDVCTTVGLLAGRYQIPLITYGCESDIINDRELYPTFLRTTGTFKDMSAFLKLIVKNYNWGRVTFVSGRQEVWQESVSAFVEFFEDLKLTVRKMVIRKVPFSNLTERVSLEAATTRVFILCAYGDDIIQFMKAVNVLDLNNGEYALIALNYLDMAHKINAFSSELDFHSFDGLLDITVDVKPNEAPYLEFLDYVRSRDDGSHGYKSSYAHSLHAALLADAILVYAVAVNATIAHHGAPHNGLEVAKYLYGRQIQGISGEIDILPDGSRNTTFLLHNIQNLTYHIIATSNWRADELIFMPNVTIRWPGGSTVPPTGYPKCGWDGELCETPEKLYLGIGIGLTMVTVVCVSIIILIKRKLKAEQDRLNRMDWKISFDRLQVKENQSYLESKTSLKSNNRFGSKLSTASHEVSSLAVQIFATVAVLDGQLVAIKPVQKRSLTITGEVVRELNLIRSLKFKTINQLIGACVDPQKICLIWAYCGKGSLADVVQNDDIKLDWIFKISFINDIVKGMIYLHDSPIQCHGRLKSSNILIDNHWCCKISDIQTPIFRGGEKMAMAKHQTKCSKLWTAPEVLRNPAIYHRGSKKADVYAFGIILQELILRTGPYGHDNIEPGEIIERIQDGRSPPYRPAVRKGLVAEYITDVMRACWEESPVDRPTFSQIDDIIRKVNKGKTTNLIDQMVHMLSKYADHLEELVAERTKQLEDEQKKTDELLCRMLPASIANDLKKGKTVLPAYFDSATVFFSDIVGFTKLAAESTSFQIVDFLNQLYTTFDNIIDKYDVYKVETIGDAYMVASGLPVRNGNKHAGEIATMALDLLASMSDFEIKHQPQKILQLRTGMHSGPVATGVVGLKMPRYCLFGDTVNSASRMESSGLALRIHVSPECKMVLDQLGGYQLEERGYVQMKGKGSIFTYFLTGKEGFNKQLPSLLLQAPLEDHTFK